MIRPNLPAVPVGDAIPRVIHMVWVGSSAPRWVEVSLGRWRVFCEETGFELRVWRDQEARGLLSGRVGPFEHPVVLADLMRVEIMYRWGGLYMDCDTIPLRDLSEWTGDRPSWMGQGEPNSRGETTYNTSTLGFRQGDPFLADVWSNAMAFLNRGGKSINHTAGPAAFRKVFQSRDWGGAVELPQGVFVAYTDKDKRRLLKDFRPPSVPSVEDLRERHPEAFTVHTGMMTWMDGGELHRTWKTTQDLFKE